ncbi:MAG: hypothetical protein WBH40_04365 [Ignavibacteriaceae bacterium]
MKKLFYILKPIIPRSVQIFLRRKLVERQIEKYKNVWPILEKAGEKPNGWLGWVDNKKFAVILTHDVESQSGHDKCINLMELEKNLGFCSSFNFVPERYKVSPELRKYLADNGFEVGVHGLNHDGKLFSSERVFTERAKKINHYLKEWNSVGFRAPAMHHNLQWMHKLDIEYDLSTFDTDPFEPQSDGVETIFPFIVEDNDKQSSYVELPYTLVQDFTLFTLMQATDIRIWKEKIDWIVEKGGMVLINVHPDYLNFENKQQSREEFSVNLYIDLLKYIKAKYSNDYWHVLPKKIAEYALNHHSEMIQSFNTNIN